MKTNRRVKGQGGFTLIEILVSLILVSLLVAAVFPVVTQQVGQADAPRLANDLVNIRSGVELFSTNLRNRQPKDLSELVHVTSIDGEVDINGDAYTTTHENRWDGPYIDAAIPEAGGTIASGFDATIQNAFSLYNSVDNTFANGDFVAIQIGASSVGGFASDFAELNALIDGETETASTTTGKLRLEATSTTAYYLAVPVQ